MPETGIVMLDDKLLERLDRLVAKREFSSRSRVIQYAVRAGLERLERLARESAKLDRALEQRHADEGVSHDLESWPD